MSSLDDELLARLREEDEKYGTSKKRKVKSSKREDVRVEVTLEDGQRHFSDLFGIAPPSGIDHAVTVHDGQAWHDEVRQYIPEIDTGYIFPPAETEAAVVAMMAGESLLCIGPKGSGKTTLQQQICARMRLPWFRVNCREDMESSAFFGTPALKAGELDWIDGPLPLFARYGGMVTMDEVSSAPAGIAMALMAPLEPNGPVYIPEKPNGDRYIQPCEWFRIGATDNTALQGDTTGRYAGTNVQNEALIDRFLTTVKLGYLSKTHEKEVIKSRVPNIPDDWCDQMLEVAALVRRAYDNGDMNFTLSPRGLVAWAAKATYWGDIAQAFKLSFANKLIDDDKKHVAEVFFKVTSIDLNKV